MYQRTVKLYHGIDNLIKFVFKNSDQQRVNIAGWDITFNMLSDNDGSVCVSKPVTVIGDTVNGEVSVIVTELDLIDLHDEFYNYSLSLTDVDTGNQWVVYTDDNYEVRGEIRLLAGRYPEFHESVKVQLPTNSNTTITSSIVTADTPTRQQSAHHTAQFYCTDFTGNILIQATLDAVPPNGNTSANTSVSWATVSSLQFVNQDIPTYTNWDGIFSASRLIILPDSGTIDKIYYRS